MSEDLHTSTRRSSARISSKLALPSRNDYALASSEMDLDEQKVDNAAGDKDYAVIDSDENEESIISSEADSYSDSLGQRHPSILRKPKPRRTSGANVRSVEASTSRSQVAVYNRISPQTSGGFTFLKFESYICHCTNPSLSQPSPERSARCKVLSYFGMIFLESLRAIYCPTHNQIVSMSGWTAHVKGSHLDWCSKSKRGDCIEMARHVADAHNLSIDQTAEDLNLPDEIDEPLSTNTSNLNLNYRCPLGCGTWMVVDKSSNFPDRLIRDKHIRNDCPEGPCAEYSDVHLDAPRWVFKVRISGQSRFHSFVLPLDWERSDDEELSITPELPLLDYSPLVDLGSHQEWPMTLGWHAYDQDIAANDHFVALRSLIKRPRCDCNTSTPNSHFLEKGLHLVYHAIAKYFRTAVHFIHEKHQGVVDAITLDSKKAKFRVVSDGKISDYRMPFSMVICMMLRFIHAVLTDNIGIFGQFKLRGVHSQFRAALALYQLIARADGDVPENDLDWATHDVLETLLKPLGLGTRPIDCPTDQVAFLWAFQSGNRYRISNDLSSFISGYKFGFRCTEIQSARIRSQKRSKGSLFYDLSYDQGASGEIEEEADLEIQEAQEENQYAAGGSAEPDIAALLEKLNNVNPEDIMDPPSKPVQINSATAESNEDTTDALILQILTEEHQWLTWKPQEFESTPYSRAAHIQYTISPYVRFDGTATHFDISRDGQVASYSTDGIIWQHIDYRKWTSLILEIQSMIRSEVANQMPSGMAVSDLTDHVMSDDLSKTAPHKQENNKAYVDLTTNTFIETMASPTESRHHLFHGDGTVNDDMLKKYITRDQDIKGLLAALLTTCCAVPMRPWQFSSIVYDSCAEADRNIWIIDGRFVTGKPNAKQLSLVFADTLFWFPRTISSELVAYLYYQQPFIYSLLKKRTGANLLYASHVWVLPSTRTRKTYSKVWNGQDINRKVRDLTKKLIGSPVDPPLARQSSQGLLRDKIPVLFQIFQSRNNVHLAEGSYRNQSCLNSYAIRHSLKGLAHATDIPLDRVSACLIIGDIWLCMHNIEPADPIWQPMVINSYIFPTVAHDYLAYLAAQNQKRIAKIGSQLTVDQDSLTRGIMLLTDIDLLEARAGIDSSGVASGYCFLQTIRAILFGGGRPRYGQTPPVGGIPLCDLAKAGAMVLYTEADEEIISQLGDALRDTRYLDIYQELHQMWATEKIPWIAVSATIFDIRPTSNPKATTATATLLDMEI